MHILVHINVVWFLAFLQIEESDILDVESSTQLDQLTNAKGVRLLHFEVNMGMF